MLFSETGGIGYISRNLRPEGHQITTTSFDDTIGIDSLNNRFADTTLSIANFSRGTREKHGATVQQRYELTYCLWVMSFDCDFYEKIRHNFNRDGAVAALVDVITAAPREKVVRLALSTLKNLAVINEEHVLLVQQSKSLTGSAVTSTARRNVTGSDFLHDMIGCGLMKAIMLMKERHWKDPEILDGAKNILLACYFFISSAT
jgi:V-ATPase subunit H